MTRRMKKIVSGQAIKWVSMGDGDNSGVVLIIGILGKRLSRCPWQLRFPLAVKNATHDLAGLQLEVVSV